MMTGPEPLGWSAGGSLVTYMFTGRGETRRSLNEGAFRRLLAIDVPPEADIHQVYAQLQAGESEGNWVFEGGHYGHPVRS